MQEESYTIGELARTAGVNVETVRYYERRGLIEKPPKPPDGFRLYPGKTLNRILFIKRAQELGFTLEEIITLLSIEGARCSEVKDLAEMRLKTINEKMADLQKLSDVLSSLLLKCAVNPDDNQCPIVESIIPKKNLP